MDIFLAGDALIQHHISSCVNDGFERVRDLAHSADIAIVNLECCIQVGEDWPAFVAGGGRAATYMAAPPFCVDELRWLGIDAVFTANNHSMDFGESGVITTLGYLDAARMHHAGTGGSLTQATAPAYIDTKQGRVALLSAADWGPRGLADLPYPWPVGALAADGDSVFPARPGTNLLRYDAVTHVDKEGLESLRLLGERLGWDEVKAMRNAGGGRSEPFVGSAVWDAEVDDDESYFFMGRKFVLDDAHSFETVPYPEDLERNARWIHEARANADYVIVGLHQQGATRSVDEPPDHTRIFAHSAIDAGADVFVAHGHGRAGAVEIYQDRPAIYGLPGLINQISQVRFVPFEQRRRLGLNYDSTASEFMATRDRSEHTGGTEIESRRQTFHPMVLHTVGLGQPGESIEIRLHPSEPLRTGIKSEEGLPSLLDPSSQTARRTLEVMNERMQLFNTPLQIKDGLGVIHAARSV